MAIAKSRSATKAQAVNIEKVRQINRRLIEHYGPREHYGSRDPLDELVLTILSQNTSDRNSGRAFRMLRGRYSTWEAVLDADTRELAEAIRVGGLANIKASRIQQVLREIIARRGSLNLSFLCAMDLPEARAWLTSLPGVGPKTAACVLCFACGMPALPVDTHVHRVSKRLGLIGAKISADAAHELLESALDPSDIYSFHVNMILHGRQICHAQRPVCQRCPLADLCDYYQAQQTG